MPLRLSTHSRASLDIFIRTSLVTQVFEDEQGGEVYCMTPVGYNGNAIVTLSKDGNDSRCVECVADTVETAAKIAKYAVGDHGGYSKAVITQAICREVDFTDWSQFITV